MLPTNPLSRLVLAGIAMGILACGQDSLVLPNEGDASTIVIVSGDEQDGTSGVPLAEALVVAVTDELHRPVVGQTVVFAPVNDASGEVTTTTVVTDADGRAATQWVLGPGVGNQQVRASVVVNGAASTKLLVTFNATAAAGAAARLIFVAQPSAVVAGVAIAPSVTVEVQDQHGNRVTDATTPVTLALGENPAGATLSGGGTVNAVGGIATFANLSLNRAGTGYTLTAAATGFSPATSVAFAVTAAVPHHLDFSLPNSARAGTTITPAQVTVRDALGNVVTSPALSITVAIQDNPAGGTLSGTKTVTTVNGLATFSNLAIDRAGNDYTLRASGGGLQLESAALDVLPGNVNGLAFAASPSGSVTGAPLGTIQVRVRDAEGNLVTTATNSITINSSVVGTLSGTNTVSAVGGVATFSNLAVTKAGAGYRLVAHASGLVDATSDAFTVGKASTTIAITGKTPSGASGVGQAVTVNYDVNIVAPGTGSLTGSVEVSDGVTSCIGGITTGGGTGSCALAFGSTGARTITARYLGDVNFEGSTSTGTSHTVNKGATTLTLTSDTPDPSQVGEGVLVGWTVASPSQGPTPTGTVTVTIAAGADDASCSAPVSAGSCTITPTVTGTVTLSGSYTGDANYNGDSDTRNHVVSKAATTTTITSVTAGSGILPPVTVSFSVTSASGASPTGNVRVTVNGLEHCNVAVGAGSCTIAGLVFAVPATYNVVATYQGDATHASSSDAEEYNVTNVAPEANNDAYSVAEDATLDVATPGVLQNDTDAQGQELSAVLASGPSHASSFTLNADGSFSYTPAADFNGSDSFTYRASDGQSPSGVATVTITVGAVNDAPSFTKGDDKTVTADAGPQSFAGWATNIGVGPADEAEAGQTLAFEVVDVTSNNGPLFASGAEPTIAPDGTLTFTPDPASAGGTATVTVRLTDSGGTANGGQNASATVTFTITVLAAS